MRAVLLPLGLVVAMPATAQTLQPLAEARLRYEQVEQGGIPLAAEGLTLRVRGGASVSHGPLTALVEVQGNVALVDEFYDGLNGPADRPLIADPDNAALYRAQLQLRLPVATFTAGRQRIALDDERFVGNVGFRQNAQTFDALRAELTPIAGVKGDVTYAWSVRTIWGVDGEGDGGGARQREVGGDNILANLSTATPVGTLTGFGYWVDQDEAAVQGFRQASKTFGVRLAGARPLSGLGEGARVAWQLSHARQRDLHRNPNDYEADYWLADASLVFGGPRLGAGYEVLGANDRRPFTSFQMPLGTNFKFNGWADKFLVTPPDGLRDLYATAGWGWPTLGPVKAVTLSAQWHRFDSDRAQRRYGTEIDLIASAAFGKTTASVRYADYDADTFATDTSKFWLQLDWMI